MTNTSTTATDMSPRLDRIEEEVRRLSTRVAVVEELGKTQQKHTDQQINEIKASLTEIKNNTTWLVRLIIGSIISSILLWIYNGGLAGVG